MTEEPKRVKGIYVGAPACFELELACQHIIAAFPGAYCCLVGSALERADWRDVDVRLMLDDAAFAQLFPDADVEGARWEFDPRWLLLTTAISRQLSAQTGLPIDFQFQPNSHANAWHKGRRNSLGFRRASSKKKAGEGPAVREPGSDA